MLFLQHNFTENYTKAIQSKDSRLTKQLIIAELAKVLVSNKQSVMDILRKNNIAVSKLDSNKRIADLIINNIDSNPKLLADVSNMLVNYTKLESKSYGFNMCDGNIPTEKVADHPEFTFALRNGMRSNISNENRALIHNAIGTNEQLQNIKEPSKVKKLWKNKKVKVVTYLGLAVLVGYGLNYLYKKYQSKQIAQNGDVTPQSTATPQAQPTPTPQPTPSVPVNPNVTLV